MHRPTDWRRIKAFGDHKVCHFNVNISASNQIESKLSGLAGRLVSDGVLSEEQATEATNEASKLKMPLMRYLVESLDVDGRELAGLASHEFGVPLFDIVSNRCPSFTKFSWWQHRNSQTLYKEINSQIN